MLKLYFMFEIEKCVIVEKRGLKNFKINRVSFEF